MKQLRLWGVTVCATYGQASLSSLLAEEQAFCAHLGAVRSSSSSEGLARAPGVSSEASLESNEVRPLLIPYLSSPSPVLVPWGRLTVHLRRASLITRT